MAVLSQCTPGESGLCGFGYRCKRHREEKSAARLPALVFPSCKAEADREPPPSTLSVEKCSCFCAGNQWHFGLLPWLPLTHPTSGTGCPCCPKRALQSQVWQPLVEVAGRGSANKWVPSTGTSAMHVGAACGVCSLPVAPHVQMSFETFWAEVLEGIWSRDEETVLEVKRSRDAGGSLWLPDCPQVSTAKSCPRGETLNSHSHSSQKQPSRWVDRTGSGEGCRAGVRVLGCISRVGAQLCPRHIPPASPALTVNHPALSVPLMPLRQRTLPWMRPRNGKNRQVAVSPWLLESF